MKSKLIAFLAGVFLWAFPPPAEARYKPFLSYERLAARADLVAVVEPVRNQFTKDSPAPLRDPRPAADFQAINTRFAVHWVIKGARPRPREITVLHFSYAKRPGPPGEPSLVIVNGADFVEFAVTASRNAESTGERTPAWLAFLRRRADGRFEAVTGQYDSADSFHRLDSQIYVVQPDQLPEGPLPVNPSGRKRRR